MADELELVPVPKEHLGSVYEHLGRLMSTDAGESDRLRDEMPCPRCKGTSYLSAAGGFFHCGECGLTFRDQGPVIAVDHENGCWSRPMVKRLRRELQSTIAINTLDVVARAAPEAVGTDELLERLNVEYPKFRAELASLSKLTRRLFGRKIWPMSGRQGWGAGERMGYRMTTQVAEWWLLGETSAKP